MDWIIAYLYVAGGLAIFTMAMMSDYDEWTTKGEIIWYAVLCGLWPISVPFLVFMGIVCCLLDWWYWL